MRIFLIFLIFVVSSYASIGYISAMRGDVLVERNHIKSKAFKGFELESHDIITTSKRGKAQLIFKDRTVIRIGRNSHFKIESYLFDKTKNSKANFRVKRGFFSAITGKIGKLSKKTFKLRTKNSTIGIRGTHFQGLVSKNNEDIACLRGSIYVTIGQQNIDVLAGEILNIKAGIPSTPKVIKSVDMENMEKDRVVEELTPEDANMKYDALLSKALTQTLLLNSSDNKVVMSVNTWETPLTSSFSDIQKARPFDVSITAEKTSLSSTYFPLKSWDGNSENGKLLKYSGEIIFIGELSTSESDILEKNGKQQISLTLDSQNSFTSGNFQYLGSNFTFSNSGNGAVSSNNFLHYSNNVLTKDKKLIFSEQGGYFADENTYANIGIVENDYFEKTQAEQENSQIIAGGFIAEKVSETDIYKKELGKNDIFSWGYWAYTDSDEVEQIRGGWVKSDLAITSKDKISEFVQKEVTASYSGEIFGTVENSIENISAKKVDGNFDFTFDFMANTIDGNMKFESDSQKYGIDFVGKNMIADDGTFIFKKSSSTIANGDFTFKDSTISKPTYMHGSGEFLGEDASNIQGGFTAGFENGDTVISGLKGEKN